MVLIKALSQSCLIDNLDYSCLYVIARSAARKQSRNLKEYQNHFFYEIATLPSVARNDMKSSDFGTNPILN
jgi:hypothetical protein